MSDRPQTHARTITSILIEAGVVTQEQVQAGLERQRGTGQRIGEALVEMGAATEEDIGWALARQLGLSFVDPHPDALDPELVHSFPEDLLRRLVVVPLVRDDFGLSVAVADPTDARVAHQLERMSGCALRLSVATPSAIRRVLGGVSGRRPPGGESIGAEADARAESMALLDHVARASAAGAREIHFIPEAGGYAVAHRVAGRLVEVGAEGEESLSALRARIESLRGPVLGADSLHAAGSIECPAGTETIRLGVSLLRMPAGVAVTLTRLGTPGAVSLEALGLEAVDLARLRGALDPPAGLCLIAGPPRCGGSTTFAAVMRDVSGASRRTLLLEGASGFGATGSAGRAVSAHAGVDWASIAVAQSADVVGLDGVLDGLAVDGLVPAAGAGRLVVARTDWTDTFALLEYLASRADTRAAFADRLRCVIQQRAFEPMPAGSNGEPHARVVFELLTVDDALRARLRAGAPAAELRETAVAGGFVPLGERVRATAHAGLIDLAAATRPLT